MRDIEKIKVNKNEAKDRKELEDELKKVKDEQLKVQAKKKVERLQLEHGVLPVASKKGNVQRGISVDNRSMGGNNQKDQKLDRDGNPIEIKIIKTKDIQDDISEINGAERLSLLPQDEARKVK